MSYQLAGTGTCKSLVPRPEQKSEGKTDHTPLLPAPHWRLGTLQLEDALARHIQEELGLQPRDLKQGKRPGLNNGAG